MNSGLDLHMLAFIWKNVGDISQGDLPIDHQSIIYKPRSDEYWDEWFNQEGSFALGLAEFAEQHHIKRLTFLHNCNVLGHKDSAAQFSIDDR